MNIIERYKAGERCFRGADIRCADLRDSNLWGADLRDSNLWGSDIRGAILRDADLRDADLRYTDLRGADLRGAILRGAILRGAILRGADLRGADLRCADLQCANLQLANLQNADLQDANLQDVDLNWESHDLIAEVLRQAAGDDLVRRSYAGLVLISREWCWYYWENISHKPQWREVSAWAAGVLLDWEPAPDGDVRAILERVVACP